MTNAVLIWKPCVGDLLARFVAAAKSRHAVCCLALSLVFAMSAIVAFGADEYELVTPLSATHFGGGNYSAERAEIYCINGAGMNPDGLTHSNGSANNTMWMIYGDASETSPAMLVVTLPDGATFNRMKIFNCNWSSYTARGMRAFTVWYGSDASVTNTRANILANFKQLDVGADELPQADGKTTYAGETYDLASRVAAKFVALDFTSTWGTQTYSSIAEVQFFKKTVAVGVPVLPVTALVTDDLGNHSVTGILENAAATVGFYAEGTKGSGYRVALENEVAADSAFKVSVNTSAWTQYDTYTFYCFAENATGATTNRVGTLYVGEIPTDKNLWQPSGSDTLASTADNWNKGLPGTCLLPLMLNGHFNNTPITWTSGENGLTATPSAITCDGYTATFTMDGGTATTLTQGGEPFAVGHFTEGVTAPTALTLNGTSFDLGENVMLGTASAAAHSSMTLNDGISLIADNVTIGHSFSLTVAKGASMTAAKTFTVGGNTGDAEPVGSEVTVCGVLSVASLGAQAGNRIVIDGGVVTNRGDTYLFSSGSGVGALIVTGGGKLVQENFLNINSSGQTTLLEVSKGASLETSYTLRACNCSLGNARFVVSNATFKSTSDIYFPRGAYTYENSSDCTFVIHADEGQTASLSVGGKLSVGEWGQKGNRVIVENASVSVSALPLGGGSPGSERGTASSDQTNRLVIAGAAASVSVWSLAAYNDSRIVFDVPESGFDAVPLTVNDISFDTHAGIDVDLSKAKPGVDYTLLTSNNKILNLTVDQIRSVSSCEMKICLTDNSLVVRKVPGFVVIIK